MVNKQGKNGIPYCDYTWNPVTGCLHSCSYCFARRIAERFKGSKAFPNGFEPMFHGDRLIEPRKQSKPSRIFVSDMGDLFGDWVPSGWIEKVLAMVHISSRHTYLFLTKNPKRYKEFEWPKNAWLGTSVENQAAADERIPLLLQTPAAVRFISAEPLLGPVDISKWAKLFIPWVNAGGPNECRHGYAAGIPCPQCSQNLDWVIVGGESGPGARPCHSDWVRSLRDQCQAAIVPFFFKQFGEWAPVGKSLTQKDLTAGIKSEAFRYVDINGNIASHSMSQDCLMERVGKKKAGRELDGHTWDEIPEIGGCHT
jgi:protein gp37